MNIGTQLMVIGTGAKSYDTGWFPKGADNAIFTYEIIHKNSSGSPAVAMTVAVYTKNRETPGSEGTAFTSFTELGSTGFFEQKCEDLKQLVRFKVTITPGTSPTGPEGFCYRFLPPTWYDTAVQP